MRPLAIPILLALASPALAASLPMANGYGAIDAPRDTDPLSLAQLFCSARIAGDMSPLDKYLAPKLENLLARATPETVPWQTVPDRPTSCTPTVLNGFDDTVGVLVELSYAAGAKKWSDTLNLERTPDSWELNNVFYAGGGNLRFRLFNTAP